MAEYFSQAAVPDNTWLGVTVEGRDAKVRIDYLRRLPAAIRFLSCEPLIEDLEALDLSGIDWVIVGGESGMQARPMKPEWVHSIMNQADKSSVAFFFKQWGTWGSDGVKRNKKPMEKHSMAKLFRQCPSLQCDTRWNYP